MRGSYELIVIKNSLKQKEMDKTSYAVGMVIGRQLLDLGGELLNIEDFGRAVQAIVSGKEPELSFEESQQLVQDFVRQNEARQKAEAEQKGKLAREEGEAFLKENGAKAGITTTASGLQYEVLTEGAGRHPKATDRVRCHYEGRLIDGTVFDSSYRRGEPATFPLSGVIRGWTEGLQLMGEGAKYRFYIPYQLAYGSAGAGRDIPPYAALIFDVELLGVE